MNTIYSYIKESILSSTNSGKTFVVNNIKSFIKTHVLAYDISVKNVDVCFENSIPYCILDSNSGALSLRLKNNDKEGLTQLQNLSGIYFRYSKHIQPISIGFFKFDNLQLDLSKWGKNSYEKFNTQTIAFSACKDVSIDALPVDFGKDVLYNQLSFSDGSTIKALPKELGNTNIYISDHFFVDNNAKMGFSALEGKTFAKLVLDDNYISFSCGIPTIMTMYKNGQLQLKQEYNEFFAPIAKLNINAQIAVLSHDYVGYDEKADVYIFSKK